MKGSWKNSVGGWNLKDSKRKTQTRKNQLSDNGTYLYYHGEEANVSPSVYRNENEYITSGPGWMMTPYKFLDLQEYITFCQIQVFSKTYLAYNWKGAWHDEFTGDRIRTYALKDEEYLMGGSYPKILKSFETIKVSWDEDRIKASEEIVQEEYYRKYRWRLIPSVVFMYNRPLLKREVNFSDGKRRKYAQKKANGMDRGNTRAWINKGDWDSEMKTHALSKSIAWEIW